MFKSEYPETVAMLINDSYVDDVIHSCETISEALRNITATDKILKADGFQMKQWVVSGDHTSENARVMDAKTGKSIRNDLGAEEGSVYIQSTH